MSIRQLNLKSHQNENSFRNLNVENLKRTDPSVFLLQSHSINDAVNVIQTTPIEFHLLPSGIYM